MKAFLLMVLLWCSAPLGAETAVLVVSGLGGQRDFAKAFAEQGQSMADALGSLIDAGQADYLQGEQATRKAVLALLDEPRFRDAQRVIVVLLGHGTHDGRRYRFNLPGPDLDQQDIVGALARLSAAEQVVIISTPASGGLQELLAQPGRLVMSATRSPGEINAVKFTEHLAAALTGEQADVDRNEILTVAEVFRAAHAATQNAFDLEKLIVSEHARLEGDGAEMQALAWRGALARAMRDPELAELVRSREALQARFNAVKLRKPELARAEYFEQLKTVLLEMAELQLQIDQATTEADDAS